MIFGVWQPHGGGVTRKSRETNRSRPPQFNFNYRYLIYIMQVHHISWRKCKSSPQDNELSHFHAIDLLDERSGVFLNISFLIRATWIDLHNILLYNRYLGRYVIIHHTNYKRNPSDNGSTNTSVLYRYIQTVVYYKISVHNSAPIVVPLIAITKIF